MNRALTLFAGLMTIAGSAFAQLPSFTLGIKGGVNMAKLKGDVTAPENLTGYAAGLFSRIGAAGVYLQPELYLTTKGGKFTGVSAAGTAKEDKVKFTSLDVPVLLGTKIGPGILNVRAMAGPVFSFVVNKDRPAGAAFTSATDFSKYKDSAISLQAGAGIDLSKLTFDVRYEAGLTHSSESSQSNQKINLWHISLGYKIL